MSQLLRKVPLGATIDICGPRGAFSYICESPTNNIVTWGGKSQAVTQLYLIGAGSGVTPMLQVIKGALENKENKLKLHLICCHKTIDSIIGKNAIDGWIMLDRLQVLLTCSFFCQENF